MVTVRLGAFARAGVESCFGDDLAVGVRAALEHHSTRWGRQPQQGGFLFQLGEADGATVLDLALPTAHERALEAQARRAGTTVSSLAVHAVLSYLAQLEWLGAMPRPQAEPGLSQSHEPRRPD